MASSDTQKMAAIPIIHAPGLPFLNIIMASILFQSRTDSCTSPQ